MKAHKEEMKKDLLKDGIVFRPVNKEIYDGLDSIKNRDLVRRIYASRYEDKNDLDLYLNTKLLDIMSKDFLSRLTGIGQTSNTIIKHIKNNSRIIYVTDYDVDGITSAVIAHKFTKHVLEHDNFEIIINKREYGNGINNILTDKLIKLYENRPYDLIITADHGSHDRDNLTKLKKELNIDIIVTDHHLIDDKTSPKDIDGFVNPQKVDNRGFLKSITGANVLYFTLLYTWIKLIRKQPKLENFVKKHNINLDNKWDYVYYLITYIGLTVISDTVDLKCFVNRKLLIKALSTINSRIIKQDTFWTLVKEKMTDTYYIDEVTFGFDIVPVLNSPGRIDNPRMSYELMIQEDYEIAKAMYEDILSLNNTRKKIQNEALIRDDIETYENNDVCLMLIKHTDGVQGVIANNKLFSGKHKLVICFTEQKRDNDIIYIGSGRLKVPNASLKHILDNVNKHSDIILSYGGHAAAVGIKIKPNLEELFNLITKEVEHIEAFKVKELIEVDDVIYSNKRIFTAIFDAKSAGPYGMGYPKPQFVSDVTLHSYRVFKKNNKIYLNAKVKLSDLSPFLLNLFYTIPEVEKDLIKQLKTASRLRLIYNISINTYMSTNKVLLNVNKIIVKG